MERDLNARLIAERERARRTAEVESRKEIERLKKSLEQRLRKEAARESEATLEKLQAEREKERVRHEADMAKLQGQLNRLSRRLEKQTGEQLGEEGEVDLAAALERAFPRDQIQRIGRGKRGADIVQQIMDGANVLGQIVYENKNVTAWANHFVTQAEKYRAQYDTPYVMIVSRAFPKKTKDFCIVHGVPIVCPRMAVALASIMRDGVAAIGKLRLAGADSDQKALELLRYLTSDQFSIRFKGIADCVNELRQQQTKERNWHENAWETQSGLHDRISKDHREISAQMDKVLTTRRPVAVAVRA